MLIIEWDIDGERGRKVFQDGDDACLRFLRQMDRKATTYPGASLSVRYVR